MQPLATWLTWNTWFRNLIEVQKQFNVKMIQLLQFSHSFRSIIERIIRTTFQHVLSFLINSSQLYKAFRKHFLRFIISYDTLSLYNLLITVPRLTQLIKCHFRLLPLWWSHLLLNLWYLFRYLGLVYLTLVARFIILLLDFVEFHWAKDIFALRLDWWLNIHAFSFFYLLF